MGVLPAFVYVCVPPRLGGCIGFPCTGVTAKLPATVWMLGAKARSSARAVSDF